MRTHSPTRYAALAVIVGALACASNKARTEGTQPEAAGAARDTTSGRDTLNAQQNPPGYRGMERDTTMPPTQQTPTDTFLQHQGQGQPQDTSGYSGIERVDTTGRAQPSRTDTTGYSRDTTGAAGVRDTSAYGRDTTGAARTDTTQMNRSNPSGLDSTGMSKTGDTTGYSPSQQPGDSTAR